MTGVVIRFDISATAPAEDTDYHIVVWLNWCRVINARGTVCAVCETNDEAQAWIDNQQEALP
jgi:hypothetical protein